MFGGNIRGKIISAEPNQKLVQSWQLRSPNWPSGQYCGSEVNAATDDADWWDFCFLFGHAEHHATMTTTFDQGSDSTLGEYEQRSRWTVPIRSWSRYDVRSSQSNGASQVCPRVRKRHYAALSRVTTWTGEFGFACAHHRSETTTDHPGFRAVLYDRFKQIGLVTSPTVSRVIQDVPKTSPFPSSTARSATKPKEKAKRKKRTTASSSSVNAVGWGDVVTYSLVAGSIVGFIGIVWGSFRQ
jgi:hypothetical protein